MRKLALFALAILIVLPVFGQQQPPDWEKVQIKLQKLADNVYLVQGIGGNIGAYVGDDGIVLIDTEQVQLGPKIEAALKTVSDKPVKYVVNTHWHGDHTGGNAYFGKYAVIIAQDDVRTMMQTLHDRQGRITNLAVSLPVITFSDQLTLHMAAGDLHVVHFAHGHSGSDSVVLFPQNKVVHMGDDLLNFDPPRYPDIDFEKDGGGIDGVEAAAEYVLARVSDDAKLIPGHGALATKADLAKYLTVLKDTAAAVQAGINQGKNLEQLKQEKVLAKWDYLGQGPREDAYIERLYNSLTHKSDTPEGAQ